MGHATQNIGVTFKLNARSSSTKHDSTNTIKTIICDSKKRMSKGGRIFGMVNKKRNYMNTMLSYPQTANSINAPGNNS